MIKKHSFIVFLFLCPIIAVFGQVTTIDFEAVIDPFTPSTTYGTGNTDTFNKTNTAINGNSTNHWVAEDMNSGNPFIDLDQIIVSGSTSFTFAIDLSYNNTAAWDATDEFIITYSIDGGAYQNLVAVQHINSDGFNNPAALDLDFDGNGDVGQELSTSAFVTYTTASIPLSANSTLDIHLQYNNLTSGNEGIFIDDIVITEVLGSSCSISSSGLVNTVCNDNSTPANSADDFISFDLNPTGANLGASYSVSVSSGTITPNSGISYGSATSFTLQNGSAGGGNVTLTLTDNVDGTCTLDQVVIDPGSCSFPACTTPSPATNIIFSNITAASLDVTFTTSGADNYLVVQSTSSTLSANPTDTNTYTIGNSIGGGTVVYNGSGNSFTDNGLSSNTTYYYFVFAYNDTACTGGPMYAASVSNNETTLTGPCLSELNFTATPAGWAATTITYASNEARFASNTGDLTTLSLSNPTSLNFDLRRTGNTSAKSLLIEISTTTQGGTYTTIATYDHSNTTASSTTNCTVDLSAYTAFPTVFIKFRKVSSTTSPWYLKNVEVFCGSPCVPPTDPIGTIAGATPVCNTTDLSYTYGGGEPLAGVTYYWQNASNGTDTLNPVSSNLTVTVSGSYYVRAYDTALTCWSSGSVSYAVVINTPPTIDTQPTDDTINEGDNVTFTVVSSDATGYTWEEFDGFTWTTIGSGTSLTLTSVPISNDGYQYRVTLSNGNGCGTTVSNVVTLTVLIDSCINEGFIGGFGVSSFRLDIQFNHGKLLVCRELWQCCSCFANEWYRRFYPDRNFR